MENGLTDDDARLEVSLVHRSGLDNTSAIFFAKVTGAGISSGRRYLNVWHEENIKETVFLDAYFLLSINWKPEKMSPMDTVGVEASAEAQSNAFEVVCHILENAGIKEQSYEEEPEVKSRVGPRRVEAKLVNRSDPGLAVEIVVIAYFPPDGPFKYHTLKGRAWNTATNKLETPIEAYHDDLWWISNVVKYVSPAGSSTSSFHGEKDTKGYERIQDFLESLHASEINVLKHLKWKQTEDDDDDDMGDFSPTRSNHGRNHNRNYHGNTGHYRNPYKPATVFFRVSGDEVGRKAYLVQAEKQVNGSQALPPSLEEFLETAEKKASAEDAAGPDESSSAVSESGRGVPKRHVGVGENSSADSSTDGLPDHSPGRNHPLDDEGFDYGPTPYVTSILPSSLSAIERSLRRAVGTSDLDILDPITGKRRKRMLH
jgi:hypothetical protein